MANRVKNTESFDLLVIGSGAAGVAAAFQAAKLHKKVAIIEKSTKSIGGSWLHTGTIPSKTMREVLSAIQAIKSHVGAHWVQRLVDDISTDSLLRRAQTVSREEQNLIEKHLANNKIKIFRGMAQIEDRGTVRVIPAEGEPFLLAGEQILVATGSRPRRPDDVPFDGWRVVDSDDILSLENLPKSLIIYGAGVIGCEYACIFGALGVDTTIVDSRSLIMQNMDQEITQELKQSMEDLGVKFILGQPMERITAEGSKAFLHLPKQTLSADVCFFAAGRISTTKGLGLERVGIEVNDRGAIVVNEFFQTEVPCIYAAGDAIGPPALASTSTEQGRLVSLHAFAGNKGKFPKQFPVGIYTIPELSSVGLSEEEVKEAGIPYVVGRANYDEIARGYIRGDAHGMLKIIVAKETQKILGIHIVGADACNLVHIGLCAMHAEMALQDMVTSVIFNYPTLAEAYRVASFNALNKIFPSGNFSGEVKVNKKDPTAA